MGIYADFISHSILLADGVPQGRAYNELVDQAEEFDPELASGFDAQDEMQSIAAFGGAYASGNYTITITPPVEAAVTTANIAYDANAATIEAALDTACNGNITGWTDGDITVAGGALTANAVTLTFDGDSVTEKNFAASVIADVDLVDGSANAAATITGANGTLTFTADEVGTDYNDYVFNLSSNGALTVTYDDVNTFTLEYDAGTTDYTAMQAAVNTAMTSNPTWPQFEATQTGNAATIDAGDDGANDTTVNGLDVGSLGAVTTTTKGQAIRYAWALMHNMGLIDSPPDQGDLLDDDTELWLNPGDNPRYPNAAVRRILAWQASIDDGTVGLRDQLEALFRIQ